MANKKRIPGPLVVALLFLPAAGMTFWFFYDSDAKRAGPKKAAKIVSRPAGEVNVLVTANGMPLENANLMVLSHSTFRRAVRRTDEQGEAQFSGISPGKTTISIRMKGFENARREVEVKVDSALNVEVELVPKGETTSPEAAGSASNSADDASAVTGGAAKH